MLKEGGVIRFIFIFILGFSAHTQTSFDLKKCLSKRSNLKNWNIDKSFLTSKNQILYEENNTLQFLGKDEVKLIQKNVFDVNPSQIYTITYDLFCPDIKGSSLKGFFISLIYKDKTLGLIESKIMTLESIACDSIVEGNWYTFSKSFHMKSRQKIRLGLNFNDKELNKLKIRNVIIESKSSSNFFNEKNFVLNGGFELNYKIPDITYSGFKEVSFWQITEQPECVYSRSGNNIYNVDNINYINGINAGSPDLVTNDLSYKYNNLSIPEGTACARYHCPYYSKNSKESTGGEYIQTKLRHPLTKGKTYELSMMVRLSEESRYIINNYGAFFSKCALNVFDEMMIGEKVHKTNQILLNNYLVKADGWIKVSTIYNASGGENYLTLGCFDSEEVKYEPKPIRSCKDCSKIGGPIVLVDDIQLIEVQE